MIRCFHSFGSNKKKVFEITAQPYQNSFYRIYTRLKSTKEGDLYEVLGVQQLATQNEIKSAFYRLSMQLHPDRNAHDKNASEKFQKLTNAYQILSNVNSRKEYDAQIHAASGSATTSFKTARPPSTSMSSSLRKAYARPPPPRGVTKEYNFDEFYRQHYGQALREVDKQKRRNIMEKKFETLKANMLKNFIIAIILALGLIINHSANVGREPPD